MGFSEYLKTAIQVAGIGQLAIVVGSLAIPRVCVGETMLPNCVRLHFVLFVAESAQRGAPL